MIFCFFEEEKIFFHFYKIWLHLWIPNNVMNLSYKFKESDLFENSEFPSMPIDEDQIVTTLSSLGTFHLLDYSQQVQILETLYLYTTESKINISNLSQIVPDISLFLSNYIQQPLNFDQTIFHFIHFLTEWTYNHNIQNEIYLQNDTIMRFLSYVAFEYETDLFKIHLLSIAILWNLLSDSQTMRNYFVAYLQNELQLKLFISFISHNFESNPFVLKISFQILNILLETHNHKSINFGIVFEDLIFPLMSNPIYALPNEMISFISLYLYHLKNSIAKKAIFDNIIHTISFDALFQSFQQFDEDKYCHIIAFLRSLIDYYTSESRCNFNVFFDLSSISSYFEIHACSKKAKIGFCAFIVSFFQQTSIYNFDDCNVHVVFNTLKSFSNDEFELIEYVLTAYYFVIMKISKYPQFFSCLFSDQFEEFLHFLMTTCDSESDTMIEKAYRIFAVIIDLLNNAYAIDTVEHYITLLHTAIFDQSYKNAKLDELRETMCALFDLE